MDRVEELENAIESLPPEEFTRIARWFRERDQSLWDRELDADSASGKLDFLFEEAEHVSRAVRTGTTVRVGDRYRALGLLTSGTMTWVWIGTHSDYDRLVGSD